MMSKKYYVVRARFSVLDDFVIKTYEANVNYIRPWDSHYVNQLSDVIICWFDTAAERDAKAAELRAQAAGYGFKKVNEIRRRFKMKELSEEEYVEWRQRILENGLRR